MPRVDNIAYDFSLFEDTQASTAPNFGLPHFDEKPRKKTKVFKLTQEQIYRSRRIKRNPFKVAVNIIYSVAVLFLIYAVIASQVVLTEITANCNEASRRLAECKTIGAQLDIKLKNDLSSREVEEYAVKNLHMSVVDPSKIKHISLSSEDEAQVVKDSNSWVDNLKSILEFKFLYS